MYQFQLLAPVPGEFVFSSHFVAYRSIQLIFVFGMSFPKKMILESPKSASIQPTKRCSFRPHQLVELLFVLPLGYRSNDGERRVTVRPCSGYM